ncbi:MAG: DUF4386 domain-containing protein [Pseudonocardia sp.]|nr:DUF4386 domain-containing protein [Pseudonocardia sp.]
MSTTSNVHSRPAQAGPPLVAPALAFAGLTVVGAVLGASGPRPTTPAVELADYLTAHATTATVQAAAVFATAIPLALFSAVAYRRLRQLGVTAPGSAIALAGGLVASAMLALSGLAAWTTTQSIDLGEPGLLRALTTLSFAAGGPGFVPFLALLLAGVAVPSLVLGLLPRALAWAGLVVAGLGMLSVFSLLTPALYVLLPVGRFGGLLWLVAAAALLPLTRRRRSTPEPAAS